MAGFAFVSPARADDAKLSDKDQKYVQDDANGGAMEVYLGKLAAEKATNADVKTFAQKMVDDHTKANDHSGIKELAKSKGYEIKFDPGDKQQKMFDKLNKLSGDDFDKEYVNMMVKDHEKAVKEFDEQSKSADDADLKKFAGDTLPTLQDHLKMIQDIQSKLGEVIPFAGAAKGLSIGFSRAHPQRGWALFVGTSVSDLIILSGHPCGRRICASQGQARFFAEYRSEWHNAIDKVGLAI